MRFFQSRNVVVYSMLAVAMGCGGAAPRSATPSTPSSTVTAEDLERNPGVPIENLLQRKVPGLIVTRTSGGGIALRIRGATSSDGSDALPLYLVNDLPIEAGRDGALPDINPYEIESIKVLKGADTAIYGLRGVNGVIAITMKKPGPKR
jgi:TonB-dependent SusC/RagA subfamily outer membrane receptor